MATIQEIIKYAKDGQLEDWVDAFLRAEGNNIAFADGLKKQKRYWIGPIEFPLNKLVRCCGPEEGMKYKVSQGHWDRKTSTLAEYIRKGGELPPLIVKYAEGNFTISDGNHRFGAYEKLGLEKYWTIFWFDSKEEFEKMKKSIDIIDLSRKEFSS